MAGTHDLEHDMNRSSWTLGTVNIVHPIPARKHIGDNVIQVARVRDALIGSPVWRSATAYEATTFAPLPTAAMPV